MWKKISQILVIATATLMYLNIEYSFFVELGWQKGLVASLFFTALAVAALVGQLYGPYHFGFGQLFNEELNCSSGQ